MELEQQQPSPTSPARSLANERLSLLRQRSGTAIQIKPPPSTSPRAAESAEATAAWTPPVGGGGRNERQQGVPVRRRGLYVVYAVGSRKGQWRLVYPVSAAEDSFLALETPEFGNRTTKYTFDSVVGVSEDEPAELKLHKIPARKELLLHRARLSGKVTEIVAKGENMVGAELAPLSGDRTVHDTLLVSNEELAGVKDMLLRLGSATPAVQVAASKNICDAVKWASDAPPGQRTETNRPHREAVGSCGGVSQMCELLAAGDQHSAEALIQHWDTIGQLCLCPKNSAAAADKGLLRTAQGVLSDSSTAPRLRTGVARMLSTFSGFCSTNSLKELISSGLLPLLIASMTEAVDQSKTYGPEVRSEREWCISTLTALARNGALREQLLDAGLAEAFGYLAFTESTKMGPNPDKPSWAYLQAAFGLASLVGQEENHPAISKDIDRTIAWMVEDLRAALDARPWPESRPPTLWVVTHGISSMAIADCNKEKLGEAGAIPLLIRVLNDIGDTTTDGAWARENATAALWALCFATPNKKQLLEYCGKLLPLIQAISEKAHMYSSGVGGGDWRRESICRTARSAANLRFKMESKDVAETDTQRRAAMPAAALRGVEDTGAVPLGMGNKVLISHHPSDIERVRQLQTLLDGNGYNVTTYDNQEQEFDGMEQLEHMVELVTEAEGVIVCMSDHYKSSKACRTEYEYCHYELGKPIVLVNLVSDYVPEGWLDQLVGSQIWHNCADDSEMQKNEDGILRELAGKVSTSVTMLTSEQEAATQVMLSRLHAEDQGEQVAASKEIHDAVALDPDADVGQRTEMNRSHREAVGTLGGVERVCELVKSQTDVPALCQHWATLGQLCLCAKNASTSVLSGVLKSAVAILSDSTSSPELRTEVALMISRMADFCADRETREIVTSGLLPLLTQAMMKPATGVHTDRDERDWCISTLTALARDAGIRAELNEAGVPEAFSLMLMAERRKLGPKADKPSEAYLKGSYGLACLVGQEENHPAISKDIDRIIPWMVEDLRNALDAKPWPTIRRALWVVTHGISQVASADCNKEQLGEAGMIPLLIRVLLEVKTDSAEGAWAEENATSALWGLSFAEANKDRMLEHRDDLHGALLRICERSGEHSEVTTFAVIASARRAKIDAGYLLWMLGLADSDDESDSESDDQHSNHILVSYAEEEAAIATALYDRLRECGYKVWVDIESAHANGTLAAGETLSKTSSKAVGESYEPGTRVKILDDTEMRKSIFMSHSRRDPAAVNIAYCMIYALRYALNDSGSPLCPVTYLPGGQEEMWIWIDKEQMAEAGGDDWVQLLTKAQKHCCANWFFLGNAFCGSSECMKEFLYADQKRFNLVPVFIEPFCDAEEDYEAKKHNWRCDRDLATFDNWESKKDMIDRLACSRQGVPAMLDTQDFTCDGCRESRDRVCMECTNWKRACATPSGPRLKDSVETLARYLLKENQLAGRGAAAVTTMTEGVAKASNVIVLCSKAYKLSPTCRSEALHATSMGKSIFCIKTEDWEGDGWLKAFMKDKTTAMFYDDSQLDAAFAALQESIGPAPETAKLSRSRSSLSRTRSKSTDSANMTRQSTESSTVSRKSSRFLLDAESVDDERGSVTLGSKMRRVHSVTTAAAAAVRFSQAAGGLGGSSTGSKDDSGSQSSGSALAHEESERDKEKREPFASVGPKTRGKSKSFDAASNGGAELQRSISRTSSGTTSSLKHGGAGQQHRASPSPVVAPRTPVSPSNPPARSSSSSVPSFRLGDGGGEEMSPRSSGDETFDGASIHSSSLATEGGGPGRTHSTISVHDHIELLHTSITAKKDAELADLRAQHKAEQDRQAHGLALLQAEQRMAEIHRLEKEAIAREAALREMRVIAMAACAVAVVIAVACRKGI